MTDNIIGWKNEKTMKSISKSLGFAMFLTMSKKKGVKTPMNSVSNVQRAFGIIDRLNRTINVMPIFKKCHIIDISSAIDFVQNDYWKNHSYDSLHQLMDLKAIRRHYGFAYCYYQIANDKRIGKVVRCDMVTFGDLCRVHKLIKNHMNLEKKIQALNIA